MTETETTTGQFIDLIKFFLVFDGYLSHLKENGQEIEEDAHIQSGLALGKRFVPMIRQSIADHLDKLEGRTDTGILRAPLGRAKRGGASARLFLEISDLFEKLLPWLKTKQDLFRSIFPEGRERQTINVLISIAQETPIARISDAVKLVPHSSLYGVKRWIYQVANQIGIVVSDDTDLIDSAKQVLTAASNLKDINKQIDSLDPGSEKRAELIEQKNNAEQKISDIVETSSDPTIIKAVSLIEQAQLKEYRTKVGQQLGLSPEQEEAVVQSGKVVIGAGAGSGKTRVLAGKVAYLIKEKGAKPHEIIATSFSKKSAAELVERIKAYGGAAILENGDQGFGTTHSISYALLREFQPSIRSKSIITSDTTLLKLAMAQVKMRPHKEVTFPEPKSIFDGLYNSKAESAENPQLTEKSYQDALRVIKDFSDWGAKQRYPWAYKNLDFISRVQGTPLASLSASDRATFNKIISTEGVKRALARKNLGTIKLANYDLGFAKLAATKVSSPYWSQPANQWFNLGVKDFKDAQGRAIGAKRFSTMISKYRAYLSSPSEVWHEEQSDAAAIYGAYDWLKKNDPMFVNQIDFDDMLTETVKMLIADPHTRSVLQARYKHIMVDEGQDLNRAQTLLFGLLAGYIDPQTRLPRADGKMNAQTFAFIGDDKQSIYSFRGAEPEIFINKSELVEGGEGFKTILLGTNYRSGKNIVDAADRLIKHNERQLPMTCKANPERKGFGAIYSVSLPSHEEAAAFAAAEIDKMTNVAEASAKFNDFGVAVRTNAEASAYGVEFLKRGIPFRSKMNFFNDYTTKALITWLQLAGTDIENKAVINDLVLRAFEVPKFGLDKLFQLRLQELARGQNYLLYLVNGGWQDIYIGDQEWRNKTSVKTYADTLWRVAQMKGSPEETLNQILTLEGSAFKGVRHSILSSLVEEIKGSPDAMDLLYEEGEGQVSEEDIEAMALAPISPLMGLIKQYKDIGPALSYIQHLQDVNSKKGKADDPDAEDYKQPAVVIDTCHGWKGLEVKHMYVSMPAGVFPHKRSMSDARELEAERRLGYVALTRGQDSVTVLCPRISHVGKPAGTSSFVQEACIPSLGEEAETDQGTIQKTAHEFDYTWFEGDA